MVRDKRFAVIRFDCDDPYLVIDPPQDVDHLAEAYWTDEEIYEVHPTFEHYMRSLGHQCVRPIYYQTA